MTGFAMDELQAAVFAALDTDPALSLKINAVWDEADAGAPYPYITMGDGSAHDLSGKTESLSEHMFEIHIWSDASGRMESKEIMTAVHSSLHLMPLNLATQKLIYIRFMDAEDKREVASNNILYHGIMRFKAMIGSI